MIGRGIVALLIVLMVARVEGSASAPPSNTSQPTAAQAHSCTIPNPLGLTVPQAIKKYGADARKLLQAECKTAGISYSPKRLTIIGLKDERQLLLYGGDKVMKLIGSFPLVSYSGELGPKLKEGDLQIPEGVYRITNLQAHSRLALGVDYPNAFDRANAARDKRTKLGGDILVHGGSLSTGCLVISNKDMEQVFTAVYDVGCRNTNLIIAPCDLTRREPHVDMKTQPKWLPALYKVIKARLSDYAIPALAAPAQ